MATIKDVAAQAKVSTATVSYVLNGTGSVTDATKQRVLDAVAALNYQPNYAARSLRTRSRTLGLVLPALASRLTDPVLAELLAGLSEGAAEQGYYVLLATTSHGQAAHELGAQLVRTGRIDGLVLLDILTNDERVRYLSTKQVPFVCAGPLAANTDTPFVTIDVVRAATNATDHLLKLGHQRIGLVLRPSDLAESDLMYEGYSNALVAAGLTIKPSLVVEAGTRQDDGMAAMQELLNLPEPPTAVLAGSDTLAFGAMHALRDANVDVGQDVSLVGFDDVPVAAHTHPPLTTIRVPRHAIGVQLAQLLIASVERTPLEQRGVWLETQLMIRRSTSRIELE